jgi:hypothetical protein
MKGFEEMLKELENESAKGMEFFRNKPEFKEQEELFCTLNKALKDKDVNTLNEIIVNASNISK